MNIELLFQRIKNDLNCDDNVASMYARKFSEMPIEFQEKIQQYLNSGDVPNFSVEGISLNDVISKSGSDIYLAFIQLYLFHENPSLAKTFHEAKFEFK